VARQDPQTASPVVPAPAPQLLVFAEALRLEGLSSWLQAMDGPLRICSEPAQLEGAPQLVIWSLSGRPDPAMLAAELKLLQERWHPAPVLVLLPPGHGYRSEDLLALPVAGLLEDPVPESLAEAVRLLLEGGRIVRLAEPLGSATGALPGPGPVLGLGGWLLQSGLQQIDAELRVCRRLLDPPPEALLVFLVLQGRERELLCARRLLLWLWGPALMAWGDQQVCSDTPALPSAGEGAGTGMAITLRERSADGLWDSLLQRLRQGAGEGADNHSGQLLALEGLLPQRRSDLLLALLEQVSQLRKLLRDEDVSGRGLAERWRDLQPELRRQALRRLAGTYVQLPREGRLQPVAEQLISGSEGLQAEAEPADLPDPEPMLGTLVQARPLLVNGRLLAPDEPQALLYLELLLSNWLIRNAERISAEVLAVCAEWPELRRYLLRPELLATRNLERLRNQLNAQQRWESWVNRPIQIYESRRPLYQLRAGSIACIDLTEPRDAELRQLGWWPQLVTLLLESRDALAPQLQALLKRVGSLLVLLLTQVVGRAIGLVGRGILQGMGRGVSRDRTAQ